MKISSPTSVLKAISSLYNKCQLQQARTVRFHSLEDVFLAIKLHIALYKSASQSCGLLSIAHTATSE